MSVRPANFDTTDGMWEYVHDDARPEAHGGALDPATVAYAVLADGSPNLDMLAVPCPFPDCGSVSFWPVGGGADALMGQSMHVLKAMEAPPANGAARGAARSTEDAVAAVKARVVATDGEDRWVLDDAAIATLAARSA